MGLVYDTASAQVIQVVKKMVVSPDIIPTEIDNNFYIQLPQLLKIHTICALFNYL